MTKSKFITIVWFRKDLRIADNPALLAAVEAGLVLPIYILDETDPYISSDQSASNAWLYQSLHGLNKKLNGHLRFFKGAPAEILSNLVQHYRVDAVYWNRCYTPHRVQHDAEIKRCLADRGVQVKSFNGSLLWEPWQVGKADGSPYKVFTPFYKKGCLSAAPPRAPIAQPDKIDFFSTDHMGCDLDDLALWPDHHWGEDVIDGWTVGEEGARDAWTIFIERGLANYKIGRDVPAKAYTSRLSPHLAFGEISPHQIWAALAHQPEDQNSAHFRSELAWREFSYHLLYHFAHITTGCFNQKFDQFSWTEDRENLTKWQRGQTGIPIVDAGMRELWQTGYMHNRVRMIVASFLTKNLLIDWRLGAQWFEHCLFDADLANNRASWQWVAGCGADAAPYFRVFNPVLQAEKFDGAGAYIRRYVPELEKVPDKYIAKPFDAPADVLMAAAIELGQDYPMPIVDLKNSRERALGAYQTFKIHSLA